MFYMRILITQRFQGQGKVRLDASTLIPTSLLLPHFLTHKTRSLLTFSMYLSVNKTFRRLFPLS